jgi:hypothetical protein
MFLFLACCFLIQQSAVRWGKQPVNSLGLAELSPQLACPTVCRFALGDISRVGKPRRLRNIIEGLGQWSGRLDSNQQPSHPDFTSNFLARVAVVLVLW